MAAASRAAIRSELHERLDRRGDPNLDVLSVAVVRLVDVHDAFERSREALDAVLEIVSSPLDHQVGLRFRERSGANRDLFRSHARQRLTLLRQRIRAELFKLFRDLFLELVCVFSNPILLSKRGSGDHDATNCENNRCPQIKFRSIHFSSSCSLERKLAQLTLKSLVPAEVPFRRTSTL